LIVVQTPLRISLFGGGTDFPDFYLQEGGQVLSSAIDKYIFVTVKQRFDQRLRVGWTRTELVDSVGEIQHELVREALRMTGIEAGVEISTMGDIPSHGVGFGSSSTVTVGVLHALHAYLGHLVSERQLAEQACEIELEILGRPIGVQDQYIAAFGGLRHTKFNKDGTVDTHKLELGSEVARELRRSLLLFYTGTIRDLHGVLTDQKNNISGRLEILREMKDFVDVAMGELTNGNVDAIGRLLHESWQLKRALSEHISTPEIDDLYEHALKSGAIGGKITGAGGGGFLLLYCPVKEQCRLRREMGGVRELPFSLEGDGTKVIFNYRR